MTADQSLPPSNSHMFFARRHRERPTGSSGPLDYVESWTMQTHSISQHPPQHYLLEQHLLDALRQKIAEAGPIQSLLTETVADLQKNLQVDRVLILPMGDRFATPLFTLGDIEARVESVLSVSDYRQHHAEHGELHSDQSPIWIVTNADRKAYANGQIDVVCDISSTTLLLPQRTWLEALGVKSYINLPILQHQQLWGMLMLQCCEEYRDWSSLEVATLKRVVQQIAIAIEQAELRQTCKHMGQSPQMETNGQQSASNRSSDQQEPQSSALMNEGMAPLKQSLKFAELVLEVTERIRDSLDESQILQTATQELAEALNVERCKIELYDPSLSTATVAYEHALNPPNCIGMTRTMADFLDLYKPLFQHQPVQFVVPQSSNLRLVNMTRLACPIFDDQGLLGNLWLFRPRNEMFNRWEIRIIQQIANECAIAIRQARLYEASQKQVRELERLSQLKDDFLKTISHELRTPLSSIMLGVQTLERILNQTFDEEKSPSTELSATALLQAEQAEQAEQADASIIKTSEEIEVSSTNVSQAKSLTKEHLKKIDRPTIQRLFQTVRMECHRENKLIEDLLTFCYLEAGKESSMTTSIDLNHWIMDIIKRFEIRIQNQQQQLTVDLCNCLPLLTTELAYLERIVSELLNNACKYTPPYENITICTTLKSLIEEEAFDSIDDEYIVLMVKNSGVEIPQEEQDRIFDKFYRIPSSDPWQYGGTGLGLALVKKLTKCLGASIQVSSMNGQTSFMVLFPADSSSHASSE
ncbi:MAG: GAF domain-containing sensor histidine kinase [Cyanobacteria bacterium P01_F01_bin.150]